jgi:hypothetical protein
MQLLFDIEVKLYNYDLLDGIHLREGVHAPFQTLFQHCPGGRGVVSINSREGSLTSWYEVMIRCISVR